MYFNALLKRKACLTSNHVHVVYWHLRHTYSKWHVALKQFQQMKHQGQTWNFPVWWKLTVIMNDAFRALLEREESKDSPVPQVSRWVCLFKPLPVKVSVWSRSVNVWESSCCCIPHMKLSLCCRWLFCLLNLILNVPDNQLFWVISSLICPEL